MQKMTWSRWLVSIGILVVLGNSVDGISQGRPIALDTQLTCCADASDNSTCIYCNTNTSFCCSNQPHTYSVDSKTPFCCGLGEQCCGLSQCCKEGEVCCSGWKSTGACCKHGQCKADGTCSSGPTSLSKIYLAIIAGVFLVGIPLCFGVCWRMRRSRLNDRRVGDNLNVPPRRPQPPVYQPDVSDNVIQQSEQPEMYFSGIPEHFLENFPVYQYGITEKPQVISTSPPKTNVADEANVNVPVHGEEKVITGEIEPLLSTTLENPDRVCCICLDTFAQEENLRLLPCMHSFHVKCIDQWLFKHTTCPLCKLDLITQEFDY